MARKNLPVELTPTEEEQNLLTFLEQERQAPAAYYARPDFGADGDQLRGNISAAEQNTRARTRRVEQAGRLRDEAEEALAFMNGELERASRSGSPAAEQIRERTDGILRGYLNAQNAYDQRAEEARAAYAGYTAAVNTYNAYLADQQKQFEAWKGTIRDAGTIRAELDVIDQRVKELQAEDMLGRLGNQFGNALRAANASSGGGMFTHGTYTPNPELAALMAQQALLNEELQWSQYYQYQDLMDAKDFSLMSRYASTANGQAPVRNALSGTYTQTGFDDLTYDYINRNQEARGRALVNSIGDNTALLGLDTSYLAQMTDEEIGIFNYLYATQGPDAAYAYTAYLTGDLNRRQREEQAAYWQKYAREKPVAASAFSVLTSPLKGVSYLGQVADYVADGRIDQNAGYNKFANAGTAIREQVTETVEDKWGPVGSFAYQTGMSMADFLLNSAITGNNQAIALTIMGSGAAADSVISAKDRGLNDDQAFWLGTLAGVTEGAIESMNMETIFSPGALKDGVLTYILKNAGAEGTEEVLTELVNGVFDQVIAGDQSQWQQSIRAYMAQGLDQKEALLKTLGDSAMQVLLSGLGGFVSGGIMSGGTYISDRNQVARENRLWDLKDAMDYDHMTAEDIIAEGLANEKGSDSRKLAERLQWKMERGKSPTMDELARLYEANMQARQDSERAWEAQPEVAQALSRADAAEDRARADWRAGNITEEDFYAIVDEIDLVREDLREGNITTEEFGASMDAIEHNRQKQGVTEYEEAERAAGAGVSDGVEVGYAGTGTGEPAGSLAGGTGIRGGGQAADRAGAAADRQNRARNLQGRVKALREQGLVRNVSSQELGLSRGTAERSMTLIPAEQYDPDMARLADRIYNETGKTVTFVTGSIPVATRQGVARVRGVYTESGIIVQADNYGADMVQIADHEAYHAKNESFGGAVNAAVKQRIMEQYTEEEFMVVLERYVKELRGVYDLNEAADPEAEARVKAMIEEEVFADAYAGINAFGAGADQFTDTVRGFMTESGIGRQVDESNGTEQPTGPPEDHYSSDGYYSNRVRFSVDDGVPESLEEIEAKYKDQTDWLFLHECGDVVFLDNMVVREDLRNQGIGTRILQDVMAYADHNGKTIALTPTTEYGTKGRLTKWYKANGFVENKGKNTDFSLRDTMYRLPRSKDRYSFAGENARTADLDALNTAKQMLSEGVAAETVRQQTGWFKGMDGKWRWEIDDSGMEYHRDGDALFSEMHPDYARHEELMELLLYGDITPGEEQELRQLHEIWGRERPRLKERTDRGGSTLQNILKHDTLFEAYPELRGVKVVFRDLPGGTRGQYSADTNTITLSNAVRRDGRNTILHELQHVIQNMEGFASGSSPEYWERIQKGENPIRRHDADLKKARARIHEIIAGLPDDVARDFWQYIGLDARGEEAADERFVLEEQLLEGPYGEEFNEVFMLLWDMDIWRDGNDRMGANELYRNTAGEIEARNTADRILLDSDSRRKVAPDLGGTDTVFVEEWLDSLDADYGPQLQSFFEGDIAAEEVQAGIQTVAVMDSVVEITGEEFDKGEKDLITQVAEFFDGLGNTAWNEQLGEVIMDRKGAKSDLGHGIGRKKAAAFAAVPAVIEQGRVVDYQKNWKGRGHDTAVVAAPVTIGGQEYLAGVVLIRSNNTNRFYVHEVMTTENGAAPFKTGARKGDPSGDAPSVFSILNRIIDVKRGAGDERFSVATDSQGQTLTAEQQEYFADSVIRDSQGRLLVLYHQTAGEFTVFDPRHQGSGSSDSQTPFGIFLKRSPGDIGLQGKKQMALYARIVNPMEVSDRGELGRQLRMISAAYAETADALQKLNGEYERKVEQAKENLQEYLIRWRAEHPGAGRREIYDDTEFQRLDEAEDLLVDEWTDSARSLEQQAKEAITEDLRSAGYDGVILEQDVGSWGRKTDAIIALDPEQVKSVTNRTPTDDPDIRFSVDESMNPQAELYQLKSQRENLLMSDPDYAAAVEARRYADNFKERIAASKALREAAARIDTAALDQRIAQLQEQINEEREREVRQHREEQEKYSGTKTRGYAQLPDTRLKNLDQEYEQAVNAGDTEWQAELVRQAAEAAMPQSVVRGENGQLLKVYHYTNGEFTVFDRGMARTGNEMDGFFFAPDPVSSSEYGDRAIAAYLNITNPAYDPRLDRKFNDSGTLLREKLAYQGYDGVVRTEDGRIYEYMAFDPEQIKSAEPVVYDDDGKVIPLSRRFDFANPDIRFSMEDGSAEPMPEDFARIANEMNQVKWDTANEWLEKRIGKENIPRFRQYMRDQEQARKDAAREQAKEKAREKKKIQQQAAARIERQMEQSQQKKLEKLKPTQAKNALVRSLLDAFSVPDGQRAELRSMISNYADRLLKNGRLEEQDYRSLFDRLYESGVMVWQADEYFADARNYLKGGKIYVSDSFVSELGDDWAQIRKQAFAAGIYLTRDNQSGAAGIDVWNGDLASMLPGLFDAEDTDQRTILERIIQVAEEGKDEHLSLAEYTARLAGQEQISEDELIDNLERQVDWALRTFAASAGIEMQVKQQTAKDRAKAGEMRLKEIQRRAAEREARKETARLAQERKEIRQMQQKTLKALQWLNQNRRRAPEELKEVWDEVLGDIDLLSVGAANELRWSRKYGATWQDLTQMYEDAKVNDPNFLPSKELENIVDRVRKRKLEDLDLSALRDLYQLAVGLQTEFHNRNNVINDEMQRLFAEIYTDAKEEIETAPGKYTGKKADKFLNLDQLTPMNVMQRMGGWDPEGTFYSMARQLEHGERDMRSYSVQANRHLEQFLREHEDWVKRADGQGKDAIWYEVKVPQLLELHMGDKPIFGETVTVYMTPAQKVHLYLESRNADNLRHMTGGRTFADKDLYSEGKRQEALAQGRTIRLAPETVKALVQDLTPEEQELADLLDGYYNRFATDEINRVSNILYGYDKAMGRNYAPIYTNQNYTKTEFGVFDVTAEGVGNLKERVHSKNPSYNISAFDAFERHVDRTARFVGMAIPARNWTTLMNWREESNSTGDVITHKWGEESRRYIEDLITNLQSGGSTETETVSELGNKLQSNYISAVFGFNPSIVLKQLGSIPMASAYLGVENLPSAAQIRNIDREFIGTYTRDLHWRTMGYATPETKHLKENPNWAQSNKAFRFLFGGDAITAMDGWAASVLWPWAENKVRREHPELEMGSQVDIDSGNSPFWQKVAQEFEDAVSRSQSVSDEIHQGTLRKSRNLFTRTFTLFRSDTAQSYNALRQKIGEARYYARKGAPEEVQKKARKAAGSVVLSMLLNAAWAEAISLLMALWKNKGKYYRDEDDELTAGSVAGEMVSNMMGSLAGVVIGGDTLSEVIGNIITGDKWYDLEAGGLEQLNEMITAVTDAGKGLREFISGGWDLVSHDGDLGQYIVENAGVLMGHIKDVAQVLAQQIAGVPVNNVEAYLLGALKWISPELGNAYDALWSSIGKSDLAGMEGEELAGRLGDILKGRNVEVSEETSMILGGLYEAGFKTAVPTDVPTKVSVDGEDRELAVHQQQAYGNIWSSVVSGALEELVGSEIFRSAEPEDQAKLLGRLYDYAAEEAKSVLFDDYETDSGFDKIRTLTESGLSLAQTIGWLQSTSEMKQADKFSQLRQWNVPEKAKAAVVGTLIGTELETESGKPSQYAKFQQAMGEGLSVDQYLDMRLGGLDVDDYLEATAGGIDGDDAYALVQEMGVGDLDDIQKWRASVDFSDNVEDQLTALSMVMNDSQMRSVELANAFGIAPDLYVGYCEIRSQYDADGNGGYTQAEVQAAIDSMGGLSNNQRAVLWQIMCSSTKSSKNNPYSVAVGQQVLDAKAAVKELETEEEADSFFDELMRQMMGRG